MQQMEYEQIQYQVEDSILTLTLHRPDKLNAFTGRMARELIDAFDRADADDNVRAIVITGAGRAFCAGADLSRGARTFDYEARTDRPVSPGPHRDGGGLLTLRIFALKKPIIAAINGAAVGVGATMTLAMDVRLASETAKFGFVFSRRGITLEAASSWFLPRLVGISQALEWTFTGRLFPASEALSGGLVRSLHDQDALLPAAYSLAREVAENTAAVSVAMTRQLCWRMLGAGHPMDAHQVDSRSIAALGKSADAREGVQAFLEKRKPHFTDRVSSDMPEFFPWWEERVFQ